MKNFKSNAWVLPQPVLIIGTSNEDGTPNAMNAAWGGQWDYHELFISLGSHATTDNLKKDNNTFELKGTGLKNDKNTKVSITFTCNENGKKVKFRATITKPAT